MKNKITETSFSAILENMEEYNGKRVKLTGVVDFAYNVPNSNLFADAVINDKTVAAVLVPLLLNYQDTISLEGVVVVLTHDMKTDEGQRANLDILSNAFMKAYPMYANDPFTGGSACGILLNLMTKITQNTSEQFVILSDKVEVK